MTVQRTSLIRLLYNHNFRYRFPCIVYRQSEQEGQNLCFIIEVYWTLYCALAFYDKKSNKRLEKLTHSLPDAGNSKTWGEMFSMLSLLNDKKDAWICSLPYNTPLDFWNSDGIFPDLFDAKRQMEIMQEVYAEIDEAERQDTSLADHTLSMRTLQSRAAALTEQCPAGSERSSLKKLSEALQYSDPVSSSATENIEHDLSNYLDKLQTALIENDRKSIPEICSRTMNILSERNRICKLSKSGA